MDGKAEIRTKVLNTLSTIHQEVGEDILRHSEKDLSEDVFLSKMKEHANAMQATLSCLRVR